MYCMVIKGKSTGARGGGAKITPSPPRLGLKREL